jgi:cytidylate kinase
LSIPVIAIDGPSASGKGTVAKRAAEVLGFHYLESGALYRLVALASLRQGLPVRDETRIAQLARGLAARFAGEKIFYADQDVTDELWSEACGNRASEVAQLPLVRDALLARQHAFRQPPGLVADGRDMGSIVFPDALLKVFLSASLAVRAERRYKQLKEKGIPASILTLSRDLEERDARDANRAVSPLVAASDAVQLDSSELSIDDVVELVVGWWRDRASRDSV